MNISRIKAVFTPAITAVIGNSVRRIANTLKIQLLILISGTFAFTGCVNYNDPMVTGTPGTPLDGRVANLAGYLVGWHPAKWPDSPQKQATLKCCAETLRSSVDTNWLAMIAGKLTNQPAVVQFKNRLNDGTETVTLVTNADIIRYLEVFSKRLTSTLDEFAGYLTDPKMKTYLAVGYEGEIPSPQKGGGVIFFNFQSEKGLIGRVRGGGEAGSAEFNENGKLRAFNIFTPENIEDGNFDGGGQLRHFTRIMNDKFAIHIDVDAAGNPHVKLITLGKHPPLKFQ